MGFKFIPRQRPNSRWGDFLKIFSLALKRRLIEGPSIGLFERRFAQVHALRYALATNSCRTGFALILKALGVGEGDEVILPAFNMSAFPKVLKLNRIKPVFVDVHPRTLNIDADRLEGALTARTKALVAVHLFGNPCDMERLTAVAKKYGLALIEDCANALGATYKGKLLGTFGDASCFSLGYSKDIPTFGGGLVLTDREEIYRSMKERYDAEFRPANSVEISKIIGKNILVLAGTSSLLFPLVYPLILLAVSVKSDLADRLFEEGDGTLKPLSKRKYANFQARLGVEKLDQFTDMQRRRAAHAKIYDEILAGCDGVEITASPKEGAHVYWRYPVWARDRDGLIKMLIEHGVDCAKVDTYDCNGYRLFEEFRRSCPVSEEASRKIVALPISHHLDEKHIRFIGNLIKGHLSKKSVS